jgi:hypothetical protein
VPVKIERTKHNLVQTRKRVLSRQPSVSSFFDAFSFGWFRLIPTGFDRLNLLLNQQQQKTTACPEPAEGNNKQ